MKRSELTEVVPHASHAVSAYLLLALKMSMVAGIALSLLEV
jgi:hypothetical protein